ncbi:MAG: TetR/AcrR family transcriptional regulator; helix-turn-helix transcriptional regulator [Rhodobacteraceae bacterium]|nr:TetR/AcrR family transcriptional regulator; helix-turn-helix transcriptional regulator [Paracoccaceae bacterium]
MGVSERRERERQARREAVLAAARSVLLERGMRNTTTKEIAERCELSEATLFFYFKNKDEILLSLIFESIDFWKEGLEKLAKAGLDAGPLLDAVWQFHEKVYVEHPTYFVISVYFAQPQMLESISDEVKDEIALRSGENFRRLANLLEQVSTVAPGRILADTIWSAFLGLTISNTSRVNLGYGKAEAGTKTRAQVLEVLKSGLIAEKSP